VYPFGSRDVVLARSRIEADGMEGVGYAFEDFFEPDEGV
jgi:hypothetical protein